MLYPLPGLDYPMGESSYTVYYKDYTILKFPPEVFYYGAINNTLPKEITIFDVYQSFNNTGLFSNKVIQDLWLDNIVPGWNNVFTSVISNFYLRYLTVNLGLGGLFAMLTPRQVIEGYSDLVLQQLS
jgi:hypothetical protein